MKTIINNNEIDGKTHPYLAICDNGTIVIFTKKTPVYVYIAV